jgi:hypothetical protein
MEPVAFTIAQLERRGSVGKRSFIYNEINAGRLEARKRGRNTIVTLEAERKYLESCPRVAPKPADGKPDPKAIERGKKAHQRPRQRASA